MKVVATTDKKVSLLPATYSFWITPIGFEGDIRLLYSDRQMVDKVFPLIEYS